MQKNLEPVRSEEGVNVILDKSIDEIDMDEKDSLILIGDLYIKSAVEDDDIITFVKKFDDTNKVIGAISTGQIFLLKAGMLKKKCFMIGAYREGLLKIRFSKEDLEYMIDWNDAIANPVENGYIVCKNIITSIAPGFIKW